MEPGTPPDCQTTVFSDDWNTNKLHIAGIYSGMFARHRAESCEAVRLWRYVPQYLYTYNIQHQETAAAVLRARKDLFLFSHKTTFMTNFMTFLSFFGETYLFFLTWTSYDVDELKKEQV